MSGISAQPKLMKAQHKERKGGHSLTHSLTFTQVAVSVFVVFLILLDSLSLCSNFHMGFTHLAFPCSFLLLLLLPLFPNLASSDLAKDRQECADHIVGLAPCLPYVGGEAKTPTIDCCTGLKQVIDKSKKCLCLLIKDRNDPNLGITLNASLALTLPSACHAPVNISECIDLLHLAPNSSEAKVFEGFDKATKTNTSTPGSTPVAPSGTGSNPSTSTSADVKSDGVCVTVWEKRWLVAQLVWVIMPFVFTFLV